ncbi:Uncharacterised protein [Clostridioides difficile]|nr:Uncharacterised protein [Clostridioides difficile]
MIILSLFFFTNNTTTAPNTVEIPAKKESSKAIYALLVMLFYTPLIIDIFLYILKTIRKLQKIYMFKNKIV